MDRFGDLFGRAAWASESTHDIYGDRTEAAETGGKAQHSGSAPISPCILCTCIAIL